MGISNACKLMVGLEYEVLVDNVENQSELDDDIGLGELDVGSCYYDSGWGDNVVGFDVVAVQGYCELNMDSLVIEIKEATERFKQKFPELTPSVYLTLNIT